MWRLAAEYSPVLGAGGQTCYQGIIALCRGRRLLTEIMDVNVDVNKEIIPSGIFLNTVATVINNELNEPHVFARERSGLDGYMLTWTPHCRKPSVLVWCHY